MKRPVILFCQLVFTGVAFGELSPMPIVQAAMGGHVHPSLARTKDGTLVVVLQGKGVLMAGIRPEFFEDAQIADKVGCPAAAVSKVVVWGDSAIDVSSATVEGKWAVEVLQGWTPEATEPSATVGADAIVSHMKDLALVTPPPTPPPPPLAQ